MSVRAIGFVIFGFCLSMAALGARPAAAEMTVGMLDKLCQSKDTSDEAVCGGYLLGVMDAIKAAAEQYGAHVPFCYPKTGLSAKDVSLAFRLWASTNPGQEKRSAISGITTAMTERFPCKP